MDAGFLNAVRGFKFTSRKHRVSDDDAVDRINAFYAPVLIVIMSSVVMTKMYLLGDPVQCWIPPEFREAWEQYAETYCWLKNTYFVPPNGSIPGDKAERSAEELKYYQWVPFVLAIQALLFYLPSVLWKLLNWQSGVQIKTLVGMAVNCTDDDAAKRSDKVGQLAWHFDTTILRQKRRKESGFFYTLRTVLIRYLIVGRAAYGRYLVNVYMIIKLLYIVNVVGQFFLLNAFLGTDYRFYGLGVLRDLWNHRDWRHSGHFPRVTLCDFNVRVIGNTHPRTLQCVLVVNLLNEKIFIFQWFMLLFVSAVTILDALFWLAWSLLPSRRYATLRRLLLASPSSSSSNTAASSMADADDQPISDRQNRQLMNRFLSEHVQPDGAFVLRMVGKNAGEPVLKELLHRLWDNYRARQLGAEEPKGAAVAAAAAEG